MGVSESTGKTVELLPPGGGERDPAWVVSFVDDTISVDVLWNEDGARCKALATSVSDDERERIEREEP